MLLASGSILDVNSGSIQVPSLTLAGQFETQSSANFPTILDADVTFSSGGTTEMFGDLVVTGDSTILVGHTFADFYGDLIVAEGASLAGDHGAAPQVSIVNEGTLGAGFDLGTFTIDSDYTQTATGTLAIDLAGTNTGQFDVINVSGVATIDGTLQVTLIAGFTPQLFDSFDVLESSTVLFSEFSNLDLPALTSGLAWEVEYLPNRVQLNIVEGSGDCPGDLNGDNVVNQSDLGVLLSAFLLTDAGDLNGDGVTNQADLGILLANFQAKCN